MTKKEKEEYLIGIPPELKKFFIEALKIPKRYFQGDSMNECQLTIHRNGQFNDIETVFDLDSLKGMVINARNDIQRRGNGGSIWLNTTDDGFENHAIGHTTIF